MGKGAKNLKLDSDFNICGYKVVEKIGEGANGQVYIVEKNSQQFALKVLSSNESNQNSIRDFRREAATLVRLKGEGVVSLVELNQIEDTHFMVMEYVEGQTLAEYLAKNSLNSAELVRFSKQLAELLKAIHQKGFLHGDLKPENIIRQKDASFKLIDMGMAVDIAGENDKQVFGSIQYAPPEQLGVISGVVDARSDLFSLGVILFQAATARLPIEELDINAHIHALAKFIPAKLSEFRSDLKESFSELVRALLYLDPDDRIPSAALFIKGLDRLEEINVQLSEGRSLSEALGINKKPRFQHLGEMVGRKEELQSLLSSWEAAKSSNGSMNFIRAESGMGKSRLAKEFLQQVHLNNECLFEVKCDEDKQISFYAIRNIFNSILTDEVFIQGSAKKQVVDLLKNNSHGFAELVGLAPALASFIEPNDSKKQELSKDQLITVASEFLLEISQILPVSTIYIDDLQWVDEDSLKVLNAIAEQVNSSNLMLVLTSRSEVVYQDRVNTVLDSIQRGLKLNIELLPLTDEQIHELIDTQLGDFQVDEQIYPVIIDKSSNNPFVSLHYLNLLIDNGLLRPEQGKWLATVDDLSALQLPNNIAELLLGKIDAFTAEEINTLSYAALLGSEFELNILAAIVTDHKALIHCVNTAKKEGMINQVDDGVYAFTHDRVREALLNKVNAGDRPMMNQHCAEAILSVCKMDFEKQCLVANFYMAGDQSDVDKIIVQCQAAGLFAFKEYSYDDSVIYLNKVIELSVATEKDVGIQVEMALGDSYATLGISNSAIQHYKKLLDKVQDKHDRALLRQKLSTVYISEFLVGESYSELCAAFDEIGVTLPRKNTPLSILTSLGYFVYASLLDVLGIKSKAKSAEEQRHIDTTIRLFESSLLVVFMEDLELLIHSIFRLSYFARKSKDVRAQIAFYISFATVFAVVGAKKLSDKYVSKAEVLMLNSTDPVIQALVKNYKAMILHYSGFDIEAEEYIASHEHEVSSWVNPSDYLALSSSRMYVSFLRGQFDHCRSLYQSMLKRFRGTENTTFYRYQIKNHFSPMIESTYGNFAKGKELVAQARIDYDAVNEPPLIVTSVYSELLYAWMTKDLSVDYQKLFNEFEQIKAYRAKTCPYGWKTYYIYKVYVLHMLLNSKEHVSEEQLQEFHLALNDLKLTSARPYLPLFRVHYHLLRGAYYRFKGEREKAQEQYLLTETLAQKENNYWGLLLVYEERAQLYEEGSQAYTMYMKMAEDISEQYGLEALTTIDGKRLSSTTSRGGSSGSTMMGTMVGTMVGDSSSSISETKNTSYLRALLQVSLSSISVVEPEKIAQLVLKEIVSVLSAERAVIFLQDNRQEDLQLVATHGHEDESQINYSSTVVKRVISNGETIIVGCSEDGELIGSESITAQGIRSVICAPLKVHDDIYGAVYLDSRIVKGVFGAQDIEILQALANQVAISIVTAKTAQVEIEKMEFEKDMDLLSNVQQMLLPEKSSQTINDVSFSAFYQPAQSCGGDWWTHVPISDDEFSIMLGDVSGHGAASAMVTSIVSSTFTCLTKMDPHLGLKEKLALTSEQLLDISAKRYLMTMCSLQINTKEKTLKTIGAGSPQVMMLKQNGEMSILDTLGTPLGLDEFKVTECELHYDKGDRLFFFTDGIVEHKQANGREVGFKRLYKMFEKTKDSTLEEGFQVFASYVEELCKINLQDDDISFLMVEF